MGLSRPPKPLSYAYENYNVDVMFCKGLYISRLFVSYSVDSKVNSMTRVLTLNLNIKIQFN